MIGEVCVLQFFQGLESQGQGLNSQGQDHGLQNCPRGSSRTRTCPRRATLKIYVMQVQTG